MLRYATIPLLLLTALAAGCGAPVVTGNERGGMIDGTLAIYTDDQGVMDAATKHCAKYGRKPLVKSVERDLGYRSALFDCA
jgi:hypothetical protein